MSKKETKNHLDRLIGEQLSAVQFIHDYLQLHFNDQGLTCYIWPEIFYNNHFIKFRDINYRNALCELINKIVKNVIIIEGELLSIEFIDSSRINLSLDSANPDIVGEIAIFHDSEGNISVFE